MNIEVSSAKVSERDACVAYFIPSISCVLLILVSNNSTVRINTYGETTSPWGTPCSKSIFLVSSPPRRMYASLLKNKRETHFRMDDPKLKSFRHSSIY